MHHRFTLLLKLIFFLLVPLKRKMNSLPWAIFLILTGREKMGKVSLCLPCFNSRQGLASQWFLEVKFKRGALLYLAGPIALKVCLRQKRCSLTESTCRSDMSRSWAQLRERFFSPSTINCLQCSIVMNYQIFIKLFILFLLLEKNRTEEWNLSNNQSMFKWTQGITFICMHQSNNTCTKHVINI